MTSVFPVWAQSLRALIVRREFRTDTITSRSGREQRRALRVTARKYLEFQALVTGDLWRLLNTSMVFGQRTDWYFPDQSRVVSAPSGMPVGNSVTVSSAAAWLIDGAKVILRDGSRLEVYTIFDVVGVTVTFVESASDDWPVDTLICPALLGWLGGEIAGQALRGVMIDLQFSVEVDPTTETTEPALAADATFNGRDVWTLEPFAFRPAAITYAQYREVVDALMGPVSRFHPIARATRLWRAEFPMTDPDDEDRVRSFFENMQGARGEFYMPTFEYDLEPKVASAAGSSTLRVSGTLTEETYSGSTTHRAVAVKYADGTIQYNSVASMTTNAGDTVITFVDIWDQQVEVTDRVSWMPAWRFATDILETQWLFDFGAPPTRWATATPTLALLEDLGVESP